MPRKPIPPHRRQADAVHATVHAKVPVVVHKADEGGYWAEVPALPGCFTQAETLAGLRKNVQIAVDLDLEDLAEPVRQGDGNGSL